MMAQQGGISQLQQRLTTGNRPQGVPPGAGPAGAPGSVPMGGMMPQNPRMAGMVPQPGQVSEWDRTCVLICSAGSIYRVPQKS